MAGDFDPLLSRNKNHADYSIIAGVHGDTTHGGVQSYA